MSAESLCSSSMYLRMAALLATRSMYQLKARVDLIQSQQALLPEHAQVLKRPWKKVVYFKARVLFGNS